MGVVPFIRLLRVLLSANKWPWVCSCRYGGQLDGLPLGLCSGSSSFLLNKTFLLPKLLQYKWCVGCGRVSVSRFCSVIFTVNRLSEERDDESVKSEKIWACRCSVMTLRSVFGTLCGDIEATFS